MSDYAIIRLGGKQYVVREGEKLLVDRIEGDEGNTFQPAVLFVGGDGGGQLAPSTTVTARVVGHQRGPKIRIGKYKPKTGYKRHNGFRAALTRIEITGIGPGRIGSAKIDSAKIDSPKKASPSEAKAEKAAAAKAEAEVVEAPAARQVLQEGGLPEGYPDLTVAQISAAAKGWEHDELEAALAYEQEHANRKGALAALESALKAEGEE